MPIINVPDPVGAASDAIGSFSAAKRQKELEDQAQAYQAKRDARADMESDRTYGLQQGEAADEHARTASEIATEQQNRDIAAATEAYNKQLRPLLIQQQQLENKRTNGEILTQQDQRRLIGIQTKIAAVNLDIQQKYGVKTAAAALSQAQASIAATVAQTAETKAETGHVQAETAETQKETRLLGTGAPGFGGGGGGRSRESAADRAQDEYDSALDALSPAGESFYNKLTSDPSMTRAQAMLHLKAAVRAGQVPKADVRALETLLGSRVSSFETASGLESSERRDNAAKPTRDLRNAVKGLPAGVQEVILKMQRDGVSIEGIRSAVDSSPSLPDDVKAAAKAALGG